MSKPLTRLFYDLNQVQTGGAGPAERASISNNLSAESREWKS